MGSAAKNDITIWENGNVLLIQSIVNFLESFWNCNLSVIECRWVANLIKNYSAQMLFIVTPANFYDLATESERINLIP